MKQENTFTHEPEVSADILVKKNIYDSVFTHLFRQPEYTLQLYQALHPEDTDMTEDQLQIVTLENLLLNQPYNDLGFLAGERLLILVEAQSTWSENILVRVLIYLAQTIQRHISRSKQNIYGSKKVEIPEPEFYVLFTGKRKHKPSQLILSEEFFQGREAAIEVRVKVIYDSTEGDIINQYVTFTRIFKEQYRIYGKTQKSVSETLRICKQKNVLKEYLEKHEEEVITMMDILFNQEYALEMYGEEIRQEGIQKGIQTGLHNGQFLTQIRQIIAKIDKQKSLETIADEMEADPAEIQPLYQLAISHPSQSPEELLELWTKQQETF